MQTFPFIDDLVDRASKSTGRFLIGIVGPPASGKSTLANALLSELETHFTSEVALLAMDGYHHTNEFLTKSGLLPWKGCHFTFDAEAFVKMVRKVSQIKEDVQIPVYDRTVHHDPIPDRAIIRSTHQIVVVEGNYLLLKVSPWDQLRELFDYTVYIDVDADIQLQRLVSRHMAAGRTREQAQAKAYSTDIPNTTLIKEKGANALMRFDPPDNFS